MDPYFSSILWLRLNQEYAIFSCRCLLEPHFVCIRKFIYTQLDVFRVWLPFLYALQPSIHEYGLFCAHQTQGLRVPFENSYIYYNFYIIQSYCSLRLTKAIVFNDDGIDSLDIIILTYYSHPFIYKMESCHETILPFIAFFNFKQFRKYSSKKKNYFENSLRDIMISIKI